MSEETQLIQEAHYSSSDAYRRFQFVASVYQQLVNLLLVIEYHKVDGIETLEYDTSAGLQIVEKQQLIACGKIFCHGLYDGGGRKVGTIYVGAIDNNRNLSPDCFLCYEIPNEIDGRKNQATIGRNHQIFDGVRCRQTFDTDLWSCGVIKDKRHVDCDSR